MKRTGALIGLAAGAIAVSMAAAWWLRPVSDTPGSALPARDVLCQDRPKRCTVTLLARLDAAPFPYKPGPDEDFWTGKNTQGEPYRAFRDRRFPRTPHFVDDRVLIHVTPHRPSGGPRMIVLYLHGHNVSLKRDVIDRRKIVDQVNASGRNIVLIAPQMAWRAIDSHPGKLGKEGGVARLVTAALAALKEGGGPQAPAMPAVSGDATAPVIVVAYSGGWRAALWAAARGGLGDRLRGVLLLDAFFGPVERWAEWKEADDGAKAFLVGISGTRGAAKAGRLEGRFLTSGATVTKRLPMKLTDQTVLVDTLTAHETLSVDGPPRWPIAEVLKRVGTPEVTMPDPAKMKR